MELCNETELTTGGGGGGAGGENHMLVPVLTRRGVCC